MIKKINNKTIINYALNGLIFMALINFISHTWYSFMPINTWIDYQKIELLDQEQGQPTQMLYSYRNTRKTVEGDYLFKTYCLQNGEWKTNSSWFYHLPAVLLEKTDGVTTVKVDMDFPYTLPKGECKTLINVKLNVSGAIRELENFTTYFKVY